MISRGAGGRTWEERGEAWSQKKGWHWACSACLPRSNSRRPAMPTLADLDFFLNPKPPGTQNHEAQKVLSML